MSGDEVRPAWARRVRAEREQRGWNKHEMARKLYAAVGIDRPQPRQLKSLVRQIAWWEKGEHFPRDWRSAYAAAFGLGEDELFGADRLDRAGRGCDNAFANAAKAADAGAEEADPTNRRDALRLAASIAPGALAAVLRDAAGEALEFTRLTGVSGVGAGTLDHVRAAITAIDRSYSAQRPEEVFAVARAYRARVQELILGPHTLKEGRELYVCAAWLSELLAWLADELGNPLTAEAYAIDCYEHADQAGHDELCAWAADALASIGWYTDRPDRAMQAARKGIAKALRKHPLAVRLRTQAAKAHARLGQREACQELLVEAAELYDGLPARTPAHHAIDTATLAGYAMAAHATSAHLWLGDYEQAKGCARTALTVHGKTSAQLSASREAMVRIDLGVALAHLGAPDEAEALGHQALTSPRYIKSILARAGELDIALTACHPGTRHAREFHTKYQAVRAERVRTGSAAAT